MKKKVLLIISAVCIVVGGIMFSVGNMMGGRGFNIDLTGSNRIKLVSELQEYAVKDMNYEAFDSVLTDLSDCEVQVRHSEDGTFGVDMKLYTYNQDNIEFGVTDGQLIIKNTDDRKSFSFNFDFFDDKHQYVYIYVPDGICESIHVSTSNERIVFEDVDVKNEVYAHTGNGQISFTNINSQEIIASSSNNEISMDGITAEVLKLETSNARLTVRNVTADSLRASTSNGTVSFDAVSGVDAVIKTSNGSIILKDIYFDNSLEAKTSNSETKVVLSGERDDYTYDIKTSNGTISIDDANYGSKYKGGKGNSDVTISTSNADVVVEFGTGV